MSIHIQYTASDALLDLQQFHPRDWKAELNKANQELNSFKRIYKTDDSVEAYNRFLKSCGRPTNAVAMLAAIHYGRITSRAAFKHVTLESRALRIEEQLKALPNCNWPQQWKEELSDYYHCQLAKINDEVNALLLELPVFNPEILS